MDIRQGVSKRDFKSYDTERLREEFLISGLFKQDEITSTYSHIDRIVVGGVMPVNNSVAMLDGKELHSQYFLERREMGVINIGESGTITADGKVYAIKQYECLYLGKGIKQVAFSSDNKQEPSKFYFNSVPAHCSYPTTLITKDTAIKVDLGSKAECNERTIFKYILPQGIAKSCQLVMGLTSLKEGSVWNTMPCHTHERRMEAYLYFNIPHSGAVIHLMGEPSETRHLIVKNEQAVISPSFSIHSGCGTQNYTFIWGMCGENMEFDDMDSVKTEDLK